MKIKRFLVRISAILMIFLSQSLADSSDSNKSNAKFDSAPPHLQNLQIYKNPQYLAQVDLGDSDADSGNSKDSNTDSARSDDENYDDYEVVDIGTSTIRAKAEYETYQSGSGVSKNMLDSAPNGNGDITSVLKILPNVQFDNAQSKSTTPGEIDPANISISGGLFYQNNFQLDGFNMNNDLDPVGGNTNGPDAIKSGRSQGLNVDSSLLDSIVVLDSNISASYGGFSGGVVEANIRNARTDGWHANISYQHTANYLTQYHIDDSAERAFYTSSDENYQPKFHKHIVRANTEGYIIDDLGLIASFTTTQSFIPLQAYSSINTRGTEINSTRTQKRQSYNGYLKAHYNPLESLTLEASLAYMPQFNTYYNAVAKNSYYEMQSGGWQVGLKALWQTNAGLWNNQLGYSYLENSRKSDANYFMSWYASDDKNWAINSGNRAAEGGYGDMNQIQNTLNYKSDFTLDTIATGGFKHDLRFGGEINYQILSKERLNDYIGFNNPIQVPNGTTCPNAPDNLGLWSCSSSIPYNQNSWSNGQYFNRISIYRQAGSVKFDNFAYSIFAEDDITLDFGSGGELKARFGLRLDGDNYMDKITLAPRFAMNYTSPAPKDWQTTITFGANRYYGRNLFAYRLYDYNQRFTKTFSRNSPTDNWVETPNTNSTSSYKFNQLNVPYDDELMGGITQNLDIFSIGLKYIHRNGKDEIMQIRRSTINAPTESGYTTNYSTWSNDGQSESHIISLIIQNIKPLQTFGINHHYLFAFDYTQTKRSYNLYNYDDAYYNDNDIMYDGQIIKYRDRPTENFALPWTLRLNTTHSFEWGRTRWLWNNFFRYKAGYDKMVIISKTNPNYNPNFNGSQYNKMHFKSTFGWDMRIGFEVDFYRGEKMRHTLYLNADIFNVLNLKNMTTLSGVNGAMLNTSFAAASSVPVYEVGRQFWLQIGYKF